MRTSVSIISAMLSAALTAGSAENIARGRPYTFSSPPNYALCKDAGDKSDLTDGIYTKGYFWTQKSTVGWNLGWCGHGNRSVTLDLGRDEPISGFSWNMAAGRAGVTWPELLFVYVSADGRQWRFVGDLFARSKVENGAPPEDVYGTYRAHSSNMPCHGRYVTFLVTGATYVFVDEIEVYRGPQGNMTVDPPGDPVESELAHYRQYRMRRMTWSDMEKVVARTVDAPNAAWQKIEREMYLFNAMTARAMGFAKPFMWACERWDNLDVTRLVPPDGADRDTLEVRMMRGETRSTAVNISNPTDNDMKFTVTVDGLPDGANIDSREVVVTCTKTGRRVGGALRPGEGRKVSFEVPAGTVKQAWISFVKPMAPAGKYNGKVVAAADGFRVEKAISLVLSPVTFPSRPRLHVGGFDYVEDGNRQYGSPGNLAGKMREMRAMYVDTPWATARAMPKGAKFGKDGALLNADGLDYRVWDDWVALWGDTARQYCVFIAAGNSFHGEKKGTPRFNRMVGEYMRAWYEHAVKGGLAGRPVYLLTIDEPRTDDMDETFAVWAKAIKSGGTGFELFIDPDRVKAEDTLPAVYDLGDAICPKSLNIWLGASDEFHRKLAGRPDKELWLYSCSGPARTFDPVFYHRAQAWRAWGLGAKASLFWAFGCGGGIGDSWRPFDQPGTEYSPFMVSPDDAMAAKQSEAVKESVEDYEYLAILSECIAAAKRQGVDVSVEERLAAGAVERVLGDGAFAAANGRKDKDPRYDWDFPNRRGAADEVRLEILAAIEKLSARLLILDHTGSHSRP